MNLEDKSIEELDALLADPSLLEQAQEPPVEAPPPTPEPPPAPEPEAAPPAEPAPVEPPPTEDKDPIKDLLDQWDGERQSWEAEKKAMAAKFDLGQAHSSRLAGKIGHLEKLLKQRAEAAQASPDPEDGEQSSATVTRLERLEGELRKRDRDMAIAAEVQAIKRPETDALSAEIAEAAEAFKDDWSAALDTEDPESARLMTRRVLNAIVAEAERIKTTKERAARVERRAATVAEIRQAKQAVASSGVSAPATEIKPKSLDEMTSDELSQLLRSMTSGG